MDQATWNNLKVGDKIESCAGGIYVIDRITLKPNGERHYRFKNGLVAFNPDAWSLVSRASATQSYNKEQSVEIGMVIRDRVDRDEYAIVADVGGGDYMCECIMVGAFSSRHSRPVGHKTTWTLPDWDTFEIVSTPNKPLGSSNPLPVRISDEPDVYTGPPASSMPCSCDFRSLMMNGCLCGGN